ncbi:MAG TPA: ABC transporter substrate-binding protein [Ilumatobacteraceae bacterium]|nr:ABC transporter substrate-binding protein [Ilumatobacteraceae bacterium]
MTVTRRQRLLAVSCVVGLALSACGRDDKDAATTTAAAASSSSAAPTSDAGSSTTAAATDSTAAAASSTTAAAAKPAAGDFGSLKAVCGAGDAKGATDQGVTDTEIVMGTASDPGNTAAPGLNQELFDAAEAFVGWCNDAGGINGRKIKLNLHDAKLFEAGAAMTEACQTDFMLAGDGMAFDSAAMEPRVACGLPQIAAFTVSKVAGRAEGSIEAMVNNDEAARNEPWLKTLLADEPDLKDFYGMWNLDLPSVTPTGNRTKNAAQALGYKMVVDETIPSAVDNWRPYVEKLKANNVQVLSYYGNPYSFSAALKTMNDVGYFPKYVFMEANFYDQTVIKEGGDLLSKTTMLMNGTIYPFELADKNPATQAYLDALKKYVPKAAPKALGVNAFSAWLLWADSAKACGSDLTRKCVMEKATGHTGWDGGGLHGPATPGPTSSESSECATLLQATPTGFVINKEIAKPNKDIWNCAPGKLGKWPDA